MAMGFASEAIRIVGDTRDGKAYTVMLSTVTADGNVLQQLYGPIHPTVVARLREVLGPLVMESFLTADQMDQATAACSTAGVAGLYHPADDDGSNTQGEA